MPITYNFDEIIDRRASDSVKWATGAIFNQEDAIPMWVADMDFRSPQPVVDAMVERARHGVFGYPRRSEVYLQAITGWFERRHGWQIEPGWIEPTPGVVISLSLAVLAFTQPGDKVIVQPPVYFPFFHIVKNNGRQIVENRLKIENGRYVMDYDALEGQLKDPRVRMLVLCSPHNPVGRVWTAEELRMLGEMCVKHNVVLVSDEIHCDLVYPGHRHVPTCTLSPEIAQNTVVLASPSKTFNLAGLSSSFAIIPNPELRRRYTVATDSIHIGGINIFGLLGVEAAYTTGEEWLDQALAYLGCNLDTLQTFVEQRLPRLKLYRPEGTYLAWLDFNGLGLDPAALRRMVLKDAGLGLNDGAAFGAGGEGFQRMNVACRGALLEQALAQLEAAVNGLPGGLAQNISQ